MTTRPHFAAYLRATDQHLLADVRAAVADALEGGSIEPLIEAVAETYDDPAAWVHLEAFTHGWQANEDPTLKECGDLLAAARDALWDRALDALS